MRGQANDAGGFERAGELAGGEEGLVEGLRGFVIRDENERGCLHGLNEVREVEGAGREGESRDAATSLAGHEVAADAIEGVRELEIGEEVADERENHACLVYQSGYFDAVKRFLGHLSG